MPATNPSPCSHIVVASYGTTGDMYPFLSLARALQERGHRVSFLGPGAHEQHPVRAGVAFHELGTTAACLDAIKDPDLWHASKGFGVVWRSLRPTLRQLPEFVRLLPAQPRCLLLAHPLLLPAAALARSERPDIRIVGAYLAPANLRTCHDPLTIGPVRIPRWFPRPWRKWLWGQVDARIVDPVALPDLNAERQARGLPAVAHLVPHMHSVADLSITLFPEWFARSQPDWPSPICSAGFQLYDPTPVEQTPEALDRFLAAGDPPIVFTPGSAHQHAAGYFEQALSAIRHLKRRAIFLTPWREQVPGELPAQVLWQAYTSFRALLPRVSAFVHHGGIGSTAEALRAAVPQLVVPQAHDQFDNGARVQALGVGTVLSASRLSARSLAASLRELLASESVRTQCRQVARQFRLAPDREAVCRAIEALVPVPTDRSNAR